MILTSRVPSDACYVMPLSLNVILWASPTLTTSAVDIARFFDLDICMYSLQLDHSLGLLIQHPHPTLSDVHTGLMNLSCYAWSGVWWFGESLERGAVLLQLRRLQKYYARGYTLSREGAGSEHPGSSAAFMRGQEHG